jgi:hypothetical protein
MIELWTLPFTIGCVSAMNDSISDTNCGWLDSSSTCTIVVTYDILAPEYPPLGDVAASMIPPSKRSSNIPSSVPPNSTIY